MRKPEFLDATQVPADVYSHVSALSSDLYAELQADDFSGDAVQTHKILPQLIADKSWMPVGALESMGFRPDVEHSWMIVSTASAETHTDSNGPTLLWVLFNSGLKLRIGNRSWIPAAGEMIVFDDRVPHSVDTPKRSCTMMWLVNVPLIRV